MKRSTRASRMAPTRICVPSTLVGTNSRAPSSIDFSTCDSAAALTITSTSATTSRTSSASRMSPCTNERRSCDIAPVRLSRFPAYVSASSDTTSYGVFARRWWMKFDGMKPAPPVTSTRFAMWSSRLRVWLSSAAGNLCLHSGSGLTRDFAQSPVRVVIVDDHRLFVDALALLLGRDERLEVIGRASDGPTAIDVVVDGRAEVVVIDVRMPEVDGIETAK